MMVRSRRVFSGFAHDMLITIEAEDKHNFKNRLREISAPTRIMAGAHDPF